MDIDYIFDTKTKEHYVANSGEHTALVNFLNQCFGGEHTSDKKLIAFISQIEEGDQTISIGDWLVVQDERDEIIVKNNQSEANGNIEKVDNDLNLMQWELECHCGKQDLLEVLNNWAVFIESN